MAQDGTSGDQASPTSNIIVMEISPGESSPAISMETGSSSGSSTPGSISSISSMSGIEVGDIHIHITNEVYI